MVVNTRDKHARNTNIIENVRGVRMLCGSTGFPIPFTELCSMTSHPHKLETTLFRTVDIC